LDCRIGADEWSNAFEQAMSATAPPRKGKKNNQSYLRNSLFGKPHWRIIEASVSGQISSPKVRAEQRPRTRLFRYALRGTDDDWFHRAGGARSHVSR